LLKQYTLADFDCAGLSITGPVRADNQDAILVPAASASRFPGSLLALADGMGGYSHGEVASNLALRQVAQILRACPPGANYAKYLQQATETANLEIYKTAQQLGGERMGTTLLAAYLSGNLLHLAHIGDSRAYLIRNGNSTCLTSDHTTVGELVRARMLPPEYVRSHEQRSVLTRALGLALFVQPDLSQTKLQPADWIVLVSDGVWAAVEDSQFSETAQKSGNAQSLCEALLELAIAQGSDDNCSAIALRIRGFRFQSYEEPAQKERNWLGFLGRSS